MNMKNFKKTHAINSWINLVLSVFIVICVFSSVVSNLLAEPNELVEEVGVKTFRMFTVLSNMLVGIAVAMSIPFAVDGIRERNYHLPRWIITLIYVSVNCITLTFLISLCLLSPSAGFVRIMASGTNLLLHTLVPISAICSFLFVNTYHTIKFRSVFIALSPVFLYAMIYLVSAIFIGESDGGWRDHYQFQKLMPWYFVLPCIMAVSFGIASLLRYVHNKMHALDKAATEGYYANAPEYDRPTVEEAVRALAREEKAHDKGGEVTVPRRLIRFIGKRYGGEKELSYLCGVYLDEYLK